MRRPEIRRPNDADPNQLTPDIALDLTPVASPLTPRPWTGPATSRSLLRGGHHLNNAASPAPRPEPRSLCRIDALGRILTPSTAAEHPRAKLPQQPNR